MIDVHAHRMQMPDWQKEEGLFWYGYEEAPEKFKLADILSHVGPGWHRIIEEGIVVLLKLGWTGGIYQVKEKFGTLRFYWNNNIENPQLAHAADCVVYEMERQTGQYCEECGNSGTQYGGGWVLTLCKECAAKKGRKETDREDM